MTHQPQSSIKPVCFVGAGPGAADLLTLRGMRALAKADVVLFDALTDPALREFAPNATWLNVGKRGFAASVRQEVINHLLVQHASLGQTVVRLKGGDPSLFGRLVEEMQALQAAGIDYEIIPGVTAAAAAAAHAQRPLTRRGTGRSLAFCTASTATLGQQQTPLPKVAQYGLCDSVVFYMGAHVLASLSQQLADAGWSAATPAMVVSNAGLADCLISHHQVCNLASAKLMHLGRPCIITIGAAAAPVERMKAKAATRPTSQGNQTSKAKAFT